MLYFLHLSALPVHWISTHGKNKHLQSQSALAMAGSKNIACPHCLLVGPFLFTETYMLGNRQNVAVGRVASIRRQWSVGGDLKWGGGEAVASNRYTFEHLFLITPFVLDIPNGLQTRHTCQHTEKSLRRWRGTRGAQHRLISCPLEWLS